VIFNHADQAGNSSEDFAPWSYNPHYLSSNEPWGYRNHRHFGCFELVYMLHGSVEQLMNGEWVKFSQGDLLAVGEEDFHAIRGSSFSYANLILPVSFWESWLNGLGLERRRFNFAKPTEQFRILSIRLTSVIFPISTVCLRRLTGFHQRYFGKGMVIHPESDRSSQTCIHIVHFLCRNCCLRVQGI
jgi:hypothetical protein